MADDNKMSVGRTILLFIGVICAILLIASGLSLIHPSPQQTKNRVPVQMVSGEEFLALKQQVADAKAEQQNLKTQLDQLKDVTSKPTANNYTCNKPDSECGPNEKSNPGTISDFGMYSLTTSSTDADNYIGFNFTDRTGFSKHFFPVCPGQTVKIGTPITIMYHWRHWTADQQGKRGCFVIDGFQNN